MAALQIQFWRGRERIFGHNGKKFSSLETAIGHIDDLLHSMMVDSYRENWTDCRIKVVTASGRPVLEVPILPAMSAIARRAYQ